MALMEVSFHSEIMGMSCQAMVILPQKNQGIGMDGSSQKEKYPVLWLLHGGSDDHTTWLRRTSIERYVSSLGIAVVMPEAHLSMYTNMTHGARYLDYIADELPEIMRSFFPLSSKREENYIAGQSMGGYGSLKIGLSRPDQYSAIGCFSAGNLIYRGNIEETPELAVWQERSRRMAIDVFGSPEYETLFGTEHDVYHLAAQRLESKKPIPRIYHVCGTEDFALAQARHARDWFSKQEIDYLYQEPSGDHSWDFWDIWIQDFLKWLV